MRLAVLMNLESTWSRHVCDRLMDLGHYVHIIDFRRRLTNGVYLDHGVHDRGITALKQRGACVHLLQGGSDWVLRYVAAAPHVRRICVENNVHALLTLYGGGLTLAAWLSRVRPYVTYAVGSDVLSVTGVRKTLTRRTLESAAIVFANGGYLAEKTRELAPSANVMPLLLGVDTDRFTPGSPAPKPVRIFCNRGFLPVYNNRYLIRGLAAMEESTTDFEVTFASGGPQLDFVKALADRVLTGPMRARVKFLGGVSDERMLDELRSSHVFVSLSRSDGTATSMLEAMSCGLFCVLSDIPQNREWSVPGADNGILAPLDQPKALGQALERAINDEDLRVRAVRFNRDLILERACSRRNMGILAEKIESIVGGDAQ